MKAFAMKAIGEVGFMEKPIPHPSPNDAIVKTTKALICTSDSHTVSGAIGPRENLTLGHEAVGTVYEVGSNVRLFKPGDRVVVGAITPIGAILPRKLVTPPNPGRRWAAGNTRDGVFAEYFHVNEADANMAPIPVSMSDEMAVYCADMLSTGFMGAENGTIPIGGTVAVFAQGLVG
jgi:threonine dehydrogenase-like Zn-dependent dehydrogenase